MVVTGKSYCRVSDANRVLADFLPRFNQRFRVPPQHAETAYRVLDPQMCLDTTLCLKYRRRVGRDNTVKYRWRTLQLLPGTDRPSYAGAVVDVLEGLDGQLAVQHEGQIIPTQKAPQRPNILRNFTERTTPTPSPHIDSNGLGRRWVDKLAQLDGELLYVVFDLQTCQFVRWVRGARRERLGEPGCCAGLHRLGV